MVHVSGIILVERGGATACQATSVAVNLTIGLFTMVHNLFAPSPLLAGGPHLRQESVSSRMDSAAGQVSQ